MELQWLLQEESRVAVGEWASCALWDCTLQFLPGHSFVSSQEAQMSSGAVDEVLRCFRGDSSFQKACGLSAVIFDSPN